MVKNATTKFQLFRVSCKFPYKLQITTYARAVR